MNKKTAIFSFIFLIASLLLTHSDLLAQCAMCKSVVETNKANGGNVADGLNTGILYLMAIPYVLIIVVGYIIFKKNKKQSFLNS